MKTTYSLTSLILFLYLSIFLHPIESQSPPTCQYTCANCTGSQYYECLHCQRNRGQPGTFIPIGGMCYCTFDTDEDTDGQCTNSHEYNRNNKAVIASFIALALLFTVVGALISGLRHFLIKIIQDVQQISIIVLINLYFPQQFDIFLTHLYKFNISSYTFQSISRGSLFIMGKINIIDSTDGQNILGKYKLLYKTANFFSNQFTWLIVFICFAGAAILLRIIRNLLRTHQKKKRRQPKDKRVLQSTIQNFEYQKGQNQTIKNTQSKNVTIAQQQPKQSCIYRWINKIYNFTWLNFFIIFFYLSLIEINVNIFTQIAHLTFSSSFASFGAFISAIFLSLELVALGLLALKIRQQTIKPQWMRDYTYTATIYLIRTNYKTATKYFWFFCCMKKILLSVMVTTLYYDPSAAILGISTVQIVFLCFAVYCQPFQRRYIRIHYYATQGVKLFLYVCLINFTQQYVQKARMIQLTKILYLMLALFFGFNFFYILINMFAERDLYIRSWIQRFYPKSDSSYVQGKLGYHSEGKLFIYERE